MSGLFFLLISQLWLANAVTGRTASFVWAALWLVIAVNAPGARRGL